MLQDVRDDGLAGVGSGGRNSDGESYELSSTTRRLVGRLLEAFEDWSEDGWEWE